MGNPRNFGNHKRCGCIHQIATPAIVVVSPCNGMRHYVVLLYIRQGCWRIYQANSNLIQETLASSHLPYARMDIVILYDGVRLSSKKHPRHPIGIYRLLLLRTWANADTLLCEIPAGDVVLLTKEKMHKVHFMHLFFIFVPSLAYVLTLEL